MHVLVGPVRTCAFHPSQPIFATGGDDNTVKVFNYQQRRLLFTLTGHADYVRHVCFHHEAPWIMSSSDDQTIRIWNWQSRTNIAIMTGHSHYVMCAQFHPRDDIVASGSLDQTVRIWDISGIRRKHANPASSTRRPYDERNLAPGQIDLFGSADGVVKFVLEHERGVNWVLFHPTRNTLYSASDDRTVKVWSMSASQVLNIDTLRGHQNNVSAIVLHPLHPNLLISDSEDRSLRVWDIGRKGGHVVVNYRRDKDRFWALAAHPALNLIAAGHDSGFIVFKLEHERIPLTVHDNTIYYVKDRKAVHTYSIIDGKDEVIYLLEPPTNLPANLAFVPAESRFILSSNTAASTDSKYQIIPMDARQQPFSGAGAFGVFVGRSRFAVLDAANIRVMSSIDNSPQMTIKYPIDKVVRLLPSLPGQTIVVSEKEIVFYDFLQERAVGPPMKLPHVKYGVWSSDLQFCALFSKEAIYVLHRSSLGDKAVSHQRTIKESTLVKSVCWETLDKDSSLPILYYTTSSHLKFALPQHPDEGIISTIEQVIYIAHVRGNVLHGIDRQGKISKLQFDPSEPHFKRALRTKNYGEMFRIIESGRLIGQSIIAYLRHTGHADIAIKFVRDPRLRMDLALESHNLEVAIDAAAKIDEPGAWSRLAEEAMQHGNTKVAEMVYRHTKDWSRLTFLYMLTGDFRAMSKLGRQLADEGSYGLAIQGAIMMGDAAALSSYLIAASQPCLALALNLSAGNTAEARRIESEFDVSLVDFVPPSEQVALRPHTGIIPSSEPWPTVRPVSELYSPALQAASQAYAEKPSIEKASPTSQEAGWDVADELAFSGSELLAETEDELAAAIEEQAEELGVATTNATPAFYQDAPEFLPTDSEHLLVKSWKASAVPACHVMARSFDTAFQLLREQVGVTFFDPLLPLFHKVVLSSNLPFPSVNTLRSLVIPSPGEPIYSAASLEAALQASHSLTTAGKFTDAIQAYRQVIHQALLSRVINEGEQTSVLETISLCKEYILGLSMEHARRSMNGAPSDHARPLELALYFAHRPLRTDHRQLAMRSAVTALFKAKCHRTAGQLARQLLSAGNLDDQFFGQLQKLAAMCDRSAASSGGVVKDSIAIVNDDGKSVCAVTHKVIADPSLCTVCGASYDQSSVTAELPCPVCQLRDLSTPSTLTSGLCLF